MRLKMLGKLLAVMLLVVFITYVPMVSCADEAQKAWLRMYASDSTYVGEDPDPWITESYVVYSVSTSSISVNITVENFKGDRDVHQIVLIIATNNTGVIDSIHFNGSSVPISWVDGPATNGPPMYTDPGPIGGIYLGRLPPHGIYNDATAHWTEYRSGENLTAKNTPGDSVLFMMTINFDSPDPGDVKIHLDAYGWIYEGSGQNPVIGDDTLDAAFAPFSHDITILIPELAFASSIAFSLGLGGYLLIKRKFTT